MFWARIRLATLLKSCLSQLLCHAELWLTAAQQKLFNMIPHNFENEIWFLIAFQGAPSWYITLSPADNKHPISLYYADSKSEKENLIADNPVASARFFHFMMQAFIKHVLGVDTDHPGIYGDTAAYYGTVEQQGRLTLHMHMLLWIR